MKKNRHNHTHLRDRTEFVRKIWTEEAVAKATAGVRRNRAVTATISFSVGFLSGMSAHHWWYVIIGASSYIIFYLLWEYAMKAWDIPAKLKDAVQF